MGWSESHYSVDFHSPAHQQTFIEISIFAYFFLSVYGLSSRPPGPRSLQRATLYPLLQPPPRPLHALCSPSCHRAPLAGYYSLMPSRENDRKCREIFLISIDTVQYLLIRGSECHISLTFQWFIFFSPPLQRICIGISIVIIFFEQCKCGNGNYKSC